LGRSGHNRRGISNVITAMLSLIIVVIIVARASGDLVFQRDDIGIPDGQYTAKIVTEKGNIATFSGS
jgi:hypothetical protein